jgi:hypothetical protein
VEACGEHDLPTAWCGEREDGAGEPTE